MADIKITSADIDDLVQKIRTRKKTMSDTLANVIKEIESLETSGAYLTKSNKSSSQTFIQQIKSKKKNFDEYEAKIESYAKALEKMRDNYRETEIAQGNNAENTGRWQTS